MRISLEWLSDFVDLPAGAQADELARQLTLKTVEVESLVHTGEALANVVIGRVADVEPLGDKGHLRLLCDVDSGQQVPVVSRASNLRAGEVVAVALPGARLVAGGEASTRVVATAQVLGVESRGIVCAAADLGLQRLFPASPADEALDLQELDAWVGAPLADAIGFNDVVLEIDNQSLTHRPDLWGHYGLARELATIYGRELKPLPEAVLPPRVEGLVGHVDRDPCRRLTVVEFAFDAETDVAPLWLRSRLARIGEGAVNIAVDLSNYVMFTVGQPAHVYDADQITLPLSVGRSGAETKLDLLNGESRELDPATPVIRDSAAPVAIAGVMGGSDSAVSGGSRRFALEVATFRPEVVRRASQRLALRTEASARFDKGLDTSRVDTAVHVFLHLLTQLVPGVSLTGMQDVHPDPTLPTEVDLDIDFLATRIGQRFDVAEVRRILEPLGFAVTVDAGHLHTKAPTWRSTGDVSLPHDIAEEVARIHGYDNIPVARPSVTLTPVRQLNRRPLDRTMREHLAARAGMQEVVTYPWVADGMLAAAGLSKDDTLRFEGAPAPDRNALRPSLIPNLLEAVTANLRYSQAFGIFEAGAVFAADRPYVPYHGVFEPLPQQRQVLAAAIVGADGPTLFRQAKGVLEMLHHRCHLTDLQFTQECQAPWADRFIRLGLTAGGVNVGTLGLLATRCRRRAEISDVHAACFDLDLDRLSAYASRENRYEPIPDLPESDFDLSIVVAEDVSWNQIYSTVTQRVSDLIHRASFVDEFRGSWVPEGHKSVTVQLTLRPKTTTLTAEHIGEVRRDAIAALEQRLGARLRE